MLSQQEVLDQSNAAMKQWGETWRNHSTKNGELFKKIGRSHKDLLFKSAGKSILCVGMGPSLEHQISTVVKHQDNPGFDIMCVDKAYGLMIDAGVKPENIKYVNIADAGISYEKWLKPYRKHTKHTNLLTNVNANPEWSHNWIHNTDNEFGNNIWFYVNKDNIQTEKIYSEISGCYDMVVAGSNIGNSLVIFSSMILGPDEILLLGYDFCWAFEDPYYAFADSEKIGSNKRNWMRHIDMTDKAGRIVSTSQNLMFSSRWLSDYYNVELKNYNVKVCDCSKVGILFGVPYASLDKKLKNARIRKLNDMQKNSIFNMIMKNKVITKQGGEDELQQTLKENLVMDVTVKYITKDQDQWLQSL